MKTGLFTHMNRLLLIIWVLALFCGVQAAEAATTYNVFERIYEPMTQPNDSIFIGTFDYDAATHTVTNLKGILSESMTGNVTTGYPGDTMTWLTLNNQLQSWHDATLGGTFATVFKNTNTNTFWTGLGGDGWSPQAGIDAGGVYYGFPIAINNPGNAYALIFVPDNPTDPLTQAQLDKLAYADFAPGGMMGAVGMTGVLVRGTSPTIDPMTGLPIDSIVGTMGGYPVEQVITYADTVPDTFSFTNQTGVAHSSVIESNAITVVGLTAPSSISITGGEYAVSTNAGSTWSTYSTTIPANVSNGNQVKVRLTSSASYSSTTTATLTIGGVSGTFNVTTSAPPPDSVPDSFSFTSLTGVDPATVYESNVITVTGINAPAAISVTGGSYAVSNDGGLTWGAWTSTAGTVALDNQVKVRGTSSAAAITTVTATLTIGGVAGTFTTTTNSYIAPPTWMPMTMLNISLNNGQLAIVAESSKSPFSGSPATTWPALSTVVPATTYDPAKPWNVLNGTAFSRRLGWNPATGATAPSAANMTAAFGAGAGIWIERTSASAGFNTYQAIGSYGVNANGTTSIDPVANGYAPIFGTAGSSTKWKWDGMMDHNANTVPAAYITTPNQLFTADYRIYIGDSLGNDIAPSSATTTTWTWQGPATVPDNVPDAISFTSQTGVATSTIVESAPITISGLAVPALISITGGEYSISTNGSTWTAFSATTPVTVSNGNQIKVRLTSSASYSTATTATMTIGGVSGDFNVTTIAPPPDAVPDTFVFTSLTGVDPATVYESNIITVGGIDTTAAISISTSGAYSVSTDNGATWSAYSATTPATVSNGNQVKVRRTSAATANTATVTTLTIGGVTGNFSITTNAYIAPPTWMPMTMLNISLSAGKLAIVAEATKSPFSGSPATTWPALSTVTPANTYDPAKPWNVLNGTAFSRRLGWNPATGATAPSAANVAAAFGAGASIWIERTSASAGFNTYQAIGSYGVNANGTTSIDPVANGYAPIFGTAGSSTKWKWDGMMDHNANTVPAAYITTPNQLFTADYRIYIGDSLGNDIAPSAATTTTWTWQGPATVPDNVPDAISFTSQTGVATNTVVESNIITVSGLAVPSLISITGGEYSVSTDGTTWSAYSTSIPATVANGNFVKVRQTSAAVYNILKSAVLTIGGISGAFDVTTAGPAAGGTLSASLAGPHTADGVSFSITGLTGSGAYDYKWAYKKNGGAMTVLKNFGVGATATLAASDLAGPGVYILYVYVKNSGSPAAYELLKTLGYTIVAVPPVTGGVLSANLAGPHIADGVSFSITGLTGSGAYDYKWAYKKNGGAMTVLKNFGVGATATLAASDLAGPGVYILYVYVKNSGSPAAYELLKTLGYTIVAVPPVTGGVLSANLAGPHIADGVSFNITGLTGSGSYDYKWAYKKNGGAMTVLKDFGVGATATLAASDLAGPGVYILYVYVKNSGSPAAYELLKTLGYTIVAVPPVTGGVLSANLAGPHIADGVSFSITGLTGSGAYDYKWAYKKNGGAMTVLKDFGAGATATLAASDLAGPGVYILYVYVKNSGSPAAYELLKTLGYTIVAVPPVTGGVLSANLAGPHIADGISFSITGLTGSGSYDYKWAYKKNGGAMTVLKDFGAGATATLAASDLAGPGVYILYVYIKNSGSPAVYELVKTKGYTIL